MTRNVIYSFVGYKKKKATNKKSHTHRYNRMVVTRGDGGDEMTKRVKGAKRGDGGRPGFGG